MSVEIKLNISNALFNFQTGDLFENSIALFKVLGYNTDRQQKLDAPNYTSFKEFFVNGNNKPFNEKKALTENWKQVHLVFQLTKAELVNQGILFDTKKVDNTIIEAYLFFAIELKNSEYTRTHLSEITREINKLFPMPVMVLFKLGEKLTLSVINRRLHKKDESKDVLEKISLIKDIDILQPHRGHIEILFDLSFQELYNNYQFDSFISLHNAWQKTLDTNELNKKFYQELANWYFWAIEKVEFPDDVKFHSNKDKDKQIRNSTNVIRLITRLIFTWFLKEKGLVPDELFDEKKLKKIINNEDKTGSAYYKAILQNLFFATLNTPMNADIPGSRKFIKDQHLIHTFYRYERFFIDKEAAIKLFENIPFLNGGLFECLDRKTDIDEIVRLDCFSDNPKNEIRLKVPDELFFSDYLALDLNTTYQTKNRKYKVRGLINILNAYKFTIHENTPVEEEVALDPELLGKVFENLLASYNPETESTARKQTGSFYTPREIVNYMVDESLLTYFTNYISKKDACINKVEIEKKIKTLLSYTEEHVEINPDQKKLIVEAIFNIKILDPACGSGAFPMGSLHKLVYVLSQIDKENQYWRQLQKQKAILETEDAYNIGNKQDREDRLKDISNTFENNNGDYGRKLYLIENSIYGIDIQPIAVQISKLRFFISLIVDQKINITDENLGVRPLPNLETKFVAANTLVGINRPSQTALRNPLIDIKENELKQVREKHFIARTPKTKEKYRALDYLLRNEIAELFKKDGFGSKTTEMLANWNPYDQNTSAGFFDTEWMFNFSEGFDIVIGNPPYGNLFKDKLDFKYISDHFDTAEYKIDAYAVFTEIGLKLCKQNGLLSYIIPYTFISGTYFSKLRILINSYNLKNLIVLGKKIFQAADVDTCILIMEKNKESDKVRVADFRLKNALSEILNFEVNLIEKNKLLHNYKELICVGTEKQIDIYNQINEGKKKISTYLTFYHGIQSRGDDIAVVSKKVNNSFPLLKGRDFSKYSTHPEGKFFVFTPENVKSGGNLAFHFAEKKIIIRTTSDSIIATIDTNKYLVLNSVNIAVTKDSLIEIEHLLGVLNSKLIDFWYNMTVQEPGKTFAEVKIVYLNKIPVVVSKNECRKIVQYLLLLNNRVPEQRSFFEALIDAIVYELYFPIEIKYAQCEVIKHLDALTPINITDSEEKSLRIIEKAYNELSQESHPIKKAMYFMNTIEEVAVIEGKKS